MKKLFYSILVFSMVGSGLLAGNVYTLDEAKVLSAETNKPILLDFFTQW